MMRRDTSPTMEGADSLTLEERDALDIIVMESRNDVPDLLGLVRNDSLCETSSSEGRKRPYHIQAQKPEDGWLVMVFLRWKRVILSQFGLMRS